MALPKEQLYSTGSYKNRSLGAIDLSNNNMDGWNFTGQTLSGPNFTNSRLNNLVGSGANFSGTILSNTDLTGAVITNANFNSTTSKGFTKAQLYSASSYTAGDISGINLGGNDLTEWNFSGQNLTNANLSLDVVDYVSGNSVRTEETVYAEGETQYENWWGQVHKNGLPGTYREILVGWQRRGEGPKVLHTIRERLAREGDTTENPYIMADIKRGFVKLLPEEEEALNAASAADRGGIVRYRPAHFNKDDVLVHLRLDEVEMNGKRYVRVGEIQSDWGQQGKKEGFDRGVDEALIRGQIRDLSEQQNRLMKLGLDDEDNQRDWGLLGLDLFIR